MDCVMSLKLQASSWRNPLKKIWEKYIIIFRSQIGEASPFADIQTQFLKFPSERHFLYQSPSLKQPQTPVLDIYIRQLDTYMF